MVVVGLHAIGERVEQQQRVGRHLGDVSADAF